MRIALQASRLGLPPSDPRHAEIRGFLELFAGSPDDVITLVPGLAAQHVPTGMQHVVVETGRDRTPNLGFELRGSARLAARAGADVLYCLHPSAPWSSAVPFVIENSGVTLPALDGRGRLAEALRRAGATAASAVIQPDDLPLPASAALMRRAPPVVSPAFRPVGDQTPPIEARRWGLDGDYALAWACSLGALERLLAAWTWVDGSFGDSVALALLCTDEALGNHAARRAEDLQLAESVRPIVLQEASDVPLLFRGARAYMGTDAGPTPQVLRWALASGAPIAAETSPGTEAVTGEAAYLVPPADTRALGAAALTILVEEEVAERLRARGLERARSYAFDKALQARMEVLRGVKDETRLR